jgi:hypothetical protein
MSRRKVLNEMRIWLPMFALLLAAAGCGGFQLRGTPSAPPPTETPSTSIAAQQTTPEPPATAASEVSATPGAKPSPIPIATPGVAKGKTARVIATGGLNVRGEASVSAPTVGKLDPGTIVTILEGPVASDDYTWWRIDDDSGTVGWAAGGTPQDPWLLEESSTSTATGGSLVNRAVRLGDRVEVTTLDDKYLTIRSAAGIASTEMARVEAGTRFVVRGGPVRQDSYLWWELEGEEVKGWAAEGDEAERWLTPVQ